MEIPKEEETLEELREGSKVEEPKLLSKMLYQHLKYVFLEENGDKPIIISSFLTIFKEKKLVEVLRAN